VSKVAWEVVELLTAGPEPSTPPEFVQ
jgi:hypothetical protein